MDSRRCSVTDCGKPILAKSLCAAHYRRRQRGTLERHPGRPVAERRGGLVKLPGIRIPSQDLEALKRSAEKRGITTYQELKDRIRKTAVLDVPQDLTKVFDLKPAGIQLLEAEARTKNISWKKHVGDLLTSDARRRWTVVPTWARRGRGES